MAGSETTPNHEDTLPRPLNEDEIIDILEEAISDLDDPANVAEFKADMKQLAVDAVRSDVAFDSINRTFKKFVEDHGRDFPGLAAYQIRWEGYKSRWTTLLWTSRDFASKTSASYKQYDQVYLAIAEMAETVEDIREAADALERFSQESPSEIPSDFAQQFIDLKRDVKAFEGEFSGFLDTLNVDLLAEAKALAEEIDALKADIQDLTKKIDDALKAASIVKWFNIIAGAIAKKIASGHAKTRTAKENALKIKQAALADVNRRQEGLANIKSEFDRLAPEFELICETLNLFADIWADFHAEALKFSDTLRKLPNTTRPKEFVLRVQLARKLAIPLQESLEEYAREI